MFKTFVNALKIKDIRTKLLFTFVCLIIIRIGCAVPIPGIKVTEMFDDFKNMMAEAGASGFLSMLSGGSFESMSILALGIGPYITSSIIMQLLTVAIPKLEEMQKDGETGRKKIAEITRYLTIGLAVFEATALSIGLNNKGWIASEDKTVLSIIVMVIALTGGSAFLMWLGEQITEFGIGNGISVILLINITAGFFPDFQGLFEQYVTRDDQKVIYGIIAAVVIVVAVLALTVLVILLQDAQRKISVQYAKKMQGRRMVGGQATFIPLRVNTAGVIPVIFASSLLQTPIIITSFFTSNSTGVWGEILNYMNQRLWFRFTTPGLGKYSVGVIVYVALLIAFAYFYTAITFNPVEVANNLKKQGGFIPGIRPGRPTQDYLTTVLNYIILIGAAGLTVIALIPIIFTGLANASIGFGGTSIIIVVGVILEIVKQVETMMIERHYKGFLSED